MAPCFPARVLTACGTVMVFGIVSAEALMPYDGAWSVRVIGESGACLERTLPLKVVNGNVSYAGWPSPTTTGRVQNSGRLVVRISFMNDVIVASGDLKRQSGQGSWNSPTLACAGRWVAERS